MNKITLAAPDAGIPSLLGLFYFKRKEGCTATGLRAHYITLEGDTLNRLETPTLWLRN